LVEAPQFNSFSKQDWLECRLRVVRIPINELLSLRCGFYEAFSGKIKVIFNGYAMIRTTRYNTKAQREQKPHMRASRETSFQVNRPWKTRQRAKLLCSKLLKEFQRNPVGRHIWKWKGKIWGRCNVQKNLNVRSFRTSLSPSLDKMYVTMIQGMTLRLYAYCASVSRQTKYSNGPNHSRFKDLKDVQRDLQLTGKLI